MINIIEKIKVFFKEHYLIISLSFLLTILIFAPLIIFPWVLGKEYQGININWFGSDAHFYLTKGKEILEGHSLGSPVLREAKNEQDPYLSYSDYILLAPIKLFGLAEKVNIATVYNAYNFIGVFILMILIYFLVLQLSGRKLLAVAAALFAIGGYSIVYNKALFYNDFNIYARVIYPFVSSLILFVYLNLLVKSLNSDKLKYKIFAGAFFGLLFYIYFYAWTFVLALNGCLFLIYLFKKDFSPAKKVFFISSLGLALGAYNLFRLFSSLGAEADKQMFYFMLASFGHGPIFSKIGFITLIIFAVYYYKRRDDKNWPLILAVILGGWVALNQQIITGRMLQYGHYYFYFIVPLSIITSFYMVWHLLDSSLIKKENLRKYLFLFLIAIVFINTAGGQYKSFFSTLNVKRDEQSYRPIIDFLNRDKRPGVILAGQDSEYLFTIYTPHDLFWQHSATFSRVPIQRFKDVLFVYYYLNKQARNNFGDYLANIGQDIKGRGTYYKLFFRDLEGYWSGYDYYAYTKKIKKADEELARRRPAIISQLNNEYTETVLKDNGINKVLKKYEINYLVWDKNKNPEWDLSGIEGLKLLYSYNNIYLYSLTN